MHFSFIYLRVWLRHINITGAVKRVQGYEKYRQNASEVSYWWQGSHVVLKSMEKDCHFPVWKSREKNVFWSVGVEKKISRLDLLTYIFIIFYSGLI